ncbi:hypothetical protein WR25_20476 [Diploscapter pachys]|uniref:SMB domain-containing protein n=1 Tax=Diploscapter pachys TaxID=2018661 RepID=A0A2A2JCB3_9BILA|nr:hypothetical protein WR25_20476 [Diploscapter pachys]
MQLQICGFWPVALLLLLATSSSVPPTEAGCAATKMCCRGRNNTCKTIDSGLPFPQFLKEYGGPSKWQPSHIFAEHPTPYYESSGDGYQMVYPDVYDETEHERIGKLILPDIIEMEGSGGEHLYDKYGPHSSAEASTTQTSPVQTVKQFIFGRKEPQSEEPEEISRYSTRPKHLLIRYSVLSQHLPLTISTTPIHSTSSPEFVFLEAIPMDCYCDEACIALGDCCSDYTYSCPLKDCRVSSWSHWSGCQPDKGICGIGVRQRVRHVTQQPCGGGRSCPPLKEMSTCFVECPRMRTKNLTEEDITTVALLLDYKFNSTRSKTARNNVYWDLPDVAERMSKAMYYCVHYQITWLNRNCIQKEWKEKLKAGEVICAECQPEATLHRKNGRCASDLEDGEEGFWKLIGPKSCNGIWIRQTRTDDCRCHVNYPEKNPFLLV